MTHLGLTSFFAVAVITGTVLVNSAQDLADVLPRIKPLEVKEALKSLEVAPGFRVELVASEPLIRSPVAVDFDEDGVLYVAEFPEYNLHRDPNFKERGAIKRLVDTDGDGIYDRAATFVKDLPQPTAVACWDGGVLVGAVPDLIYFKDTDGDGVADQRRILLTGFKRDTAGEAMLNSIRWGLDNRFLISTSMAGGELRPGDQPSAAPTNVRGRFLQLDPRSGAVETTVGHGQHGMAMDDWGRVFVCDNSNPIHLVHYDGRYALRNPDVAAPPPAVNIHAHAAEPKLLRVSALEPWRIARTELRLKGIAKGPTEGGRIGGHFTGATGVTILRGDAFPPEMRGQAIVGEVSNNLVHRMKLTPRGTSLVAERADAGREFLASRDNWFRPCQFANGPDGCLYVVDIYRELIETVESIPPQILKHLHPESGTDRGRIWRIVPEKFARRPLPHLGKQSTEALVATLDHANGWHRDTASRLLYQRQDQKAVEPLRTLVRKGRTPQGRMHALASLAGLKALTADDTVAAMKDADEKVRAAAIRLSESFATASKVREAWVERVADPSLAVRYQLAFSLGAVGGADTASFVPELTALARKDGTDRWARFAILSSARGRMTQLAVAVLDDDAWRRGEAGRALLHDLVPAIANGVEDAAPLRERLAKIPGNEPALSELRNAVAVNTIRRGAKGNEKAARDLLDRAKTAAADPKRPIAERVESTRLLALGSFAEGETLQSLLDPRQPEVLQKTALESLGQLRDDRIAGIMVQAWPSLSPTVRATAVEMLCSRPAWTMHFLDAVAQGNVKPGEVDPARVTLLLKSPDSKVRQRASKVFAASRSSSRADIVARYRPALDKTGDVERGRMLFRKHCVACHRLEGVGTQVGGELAGIKARGAEFLLLNILDPNREVLPKFLAYQIQTDAGRAVSGMIESETATSVTIRRPDGVSETIPRSTIESLRSTGVSFMPEGLESQIDVPALADLIAYLLSAS